MSFSTVFFNLSQSFKKFTTAISTANMNNLVYINDTDIEFT